MKFNVFMLSYRGYGRSTGTPNEKGLKIDSQRALDFILDHPILQHTPLFAYGQSIGGAVAIDLVHRNQARFAGIIIENTFLSIRALIPSVMPLAAPIAQLCHQIWATETLITTMNTPILFLSGLKDELVPPQHMRKLYELCGSGNKVWREFARGTHNDTVIQPEYFNIIADWVEFTSKNQ